MNQADKRKRNRVCMIAAASVVKPNHPGPPIEAEIVNISYGGVGIYTKEPLEGRVEVAIILKVGTTRQVAETVSGQVIWKKPVGSRYAVGISFVGLNPKDHSRLLSFLEQAAREQPYSQSRQ